MFQATNHPIKVDRGGITEALKPVAAYPGTPKIVLDSTGAPTLRSALETYVMEQYAPHITIDSKSKTVLKHMSFEGSAPIDEWSSQAPHKRGQVVWVCIVKNPGDELPDDEVKWIGGVIAELAETLGITTANVTDFPGAVTSRDKLVLMSLGAWYGFTGIASAGVVPFVQRFGPGRFNRDIFLEGLRPAHRIRKEAGADWPPFRGKPLQVGSKGKMVVRLQKVFGMEETGEFDEDLGTEIKFFKTGRGLPPDATVDAAVWKSLGEYFEE